jgi:hypothetical protein
LGITATCTFHQADAGGIESRDSLVAVGVETGGAVGRIDRVSLELIALGSARC